jgi:hypothetical protein
MSGGKVPTYREWLKSRQENTNENRARANAFHDTQGIENQTFWEWIRSTFSELNSIYHALEWAENYRVEDDAKIMQAITESQKRMELALKTLLGLNYSATDKDIEERAKEFGNLVENLIEKKKEFDNVTEKMK